MSADIIDLEALKADIAATERLHAALCIAAEETSESILSSEGRAQLIAAVAAGIGPGWRLSRSPA